MSGPSRSTWSGSVSWLGAGVAVSLLLHLSVGVLLISTATPSVQIHTPTQEVRDEPTPRPQLRLGLEESTIASINWLGFSDPTEHAAPQLFELDQAALARVASTPAEAQTTPAIDPATSTPTPPSESLKESVSESARNVSEAAPEEPSQALPAAVEESPFVIEMPRRDDAATTSETETKPQETKPQETGPQETEPTEDASPESQDTRPVVVPAEPAPPAPVGPPQPSETPPSKLAVPDDRDSSPTAKQISLTLDKIGKPAAGEGIEIKTVRLDTQDKAIRMLVGSLKDPVVMIEFKRQKEGPAIVSTADFERVDQPDGTVIVRGTQNVDIDRILRLNIYRWTATGKAIDELEIGKTVQIRLSIDLH